MGALARAYLPDSASSSTRARAWTLPAIFWTALAAGVLLKGPVIVMIVGLAAGTLVIVDRSVRWLMALRPLPGVVWFALLVLPWFVAIMSRTGDAFLPESVGQDLLSKVLQRPGIARRAARLLLCAVLGDLLAGGDACGAGGAGGVGGAARAGDEIPAGLAGAGLDRVRARRDQAAALCAAALSGDRHPDRRRRRRAHAVRAAVAACAERSGGSSCRFWSASRSSSRSIVIGRQFGLLVWPLIGAAAVMGFLAWQFYEAEGAEQALLRAMALRS